MPKSDRIKGPREVFMLVEIQTPDDYAVFQHRILARQEKTAWIATSEAYAYVNHGRWLVDCQCGNGLPVDSRDSVAYCIDCGAQYRRVIFPPEWLAIESVLLPREDVNRNWRAPETLATLRAENQQQGIA